ncbi:unnamed protein product [Parnassius mnemosyne]|uniref:Uncharacterized protein n=1 Tax=Parnassius mnemosyne TaxID=213953 RepID=A0AAV1M0L9_9NEOP
MFVQRIATHVYCNHCVHSPIKVSSSHSFSLAKVWIPFTQSFPLPLSLQGKIHVTVQITICIQRFQEV